jgi:polysaccharide deacetylase 2 family uncharacterized protein YibQ
VREVTRISAPPPEPFVIPAPRLPVVQAPLALPEPLAEPKTVAPAPVGPPLRRFAVPIPPPPPHERARIVLVIDDMGVDRHMTAKATALPSPLTMSFLPYGSHIAADAATARAAGHELMLHMPMEPVGAQDPAPNALLVKLPLDELRRRIAWNLDQFDGYVAVNNHMGSRFTADETLMGEVIAALSARGVASLDSRTTGSSAGLRVARMAQLPARSRDVFLDHDPSRAAVDGQLAVLEALAHKRGLAIAIGHPREPTIAALTAWLPTLADKGFVVVPFSSTLGHGAPEG